MRRYSLCALLCAIAIVAGCHSKPSTMLSGTVTIDDKPVGDGNDAVIRFDPESAGGNSGESFLKEGKYEVKLNPGKYKVAITWTKSTGKKMKQKVAGPGGDSEVLEQLIPPEYNTSSKLTADVSGEKMVKDFPLTTSKK